MGRRFKRLVSIAITSRMGASSWLCRVGHEKWGALIRAPHAKFGIRIAQFGDPKTFRTAVLFRCYHRRCDGNVRAAVSLGGELHGALTQREQRVVAAEANVGARMEFGA